MPDDCVEKKWDSRTRQEARIRLRYPASTYLVDAGEGSSLSESRVAARSALAQNIQATIAARINLARSYYRSNTEELDLEFFDEQVVIRSQFRYGEQIRFGASDSFPFCGRFVSVSHLERSAVAGLLGAEIENAATLLEGAASDALRSATQWDPKGFLAAARVAMDAMATIDALASQYFAVVGGEAKSVTSARNRIAEVDSAARRLREGLRPALRLTGDKIDDALGSTLLGELDKALADCGLQSNVGKCSRDNRLYVTVRVGKDCGLSRGASHVCRIALDVSVGLCRGGTELKRFTVKSDRFKAAYSDRTAVERAVKDLDATKLGARFKTELAHLLP